MHGDDTGDDLLESKKATRAKLVILYPMPRAGGNTRTTCFGLGVIVAANPSDLSSVRHCGEAKVARGPGGDEAISLAMRLKGVTVQVGSESGNTSMSDSNAMESHGNAENLRSHNKDCPESGLLNLDSIHDDPVDKEGRDEWQGSGE
jgi:hypothetical protein